MKKSLYIACGMALMLIIGMIVVPAGPDTAGAHDGLLSMKPKRPALPEPDPFGEKELAKGKFLVASHNLSDPRFHETVVLLIDYSANGATGIIINKPTKVTLAEALPSMPGLKKRSDIVYYGGPVENHILLMLIQSGEKPEEADRVFGDVYVSASKNTLELMIGSKKTEKQMRTYSGYAGWMAGQLDWEVSRGDWFIVQADARSIFESDASGIWRELIRRGPAIQVRHHNGVSLGAEQSGPAAGCFGGCSFGREDYPDVVKNQ
jgi:putative transcriptional regulator